MPPIRRGGTSSAPRIAPRIAISQFTPTAAPQAARATLAQATPVAAAVQYHKPTVDHQAQTASTLASILATSAPSSPSPTSSAATPAPIAGVSPSSGGGGGGDGSAGPAGPSDSSDNQTTDPQGGSASTTPQQEQDGPSEEEFIAQMQEAYAQQQEASAEPQQDAAMSEEEQQFIQDMQAQAAEIAGDPSAPRFCSFVQDNRLCTVGLVPSAYGAIPVVSTVRMSGYPNGKAEMGADPKLDRALQATMSKLISKGEIETIRSACADLVERSREGDQNAMAMLAMIRTNAKKGDKRARVSYGLAADYIKTHPSGSAANLNGEPNMRAAVQLANGPSITKERVQDFVASFGYGHTRTKQKRHKQAMIHGIANFGAEVSPDIMAKLDRIEAGLVELGRTIGMAFAIQRVRQPSAPVSTYSEAASWELGE
jgi:hypothetical protein